jgi:tRNA nucleotidyltransferase (CCA-adding enzyme)
MDFVVTHNFADLDALASLVAAGKIYEGAVLVQPALLESNVSEYLERYEEISLRLVPERYVNPETASRVILVDVSVPRRTGSFRQVLERGGLEVHIYDHHVGHPGAIRGDLELIRPVGATTTILVSLIKERGIEVSPTEATLFALGIYEETKSMTYTSTTPLDLEAVSFLLSKGAELSVVSDFMNKELTSEQIKMLGTLLDNAKGYFINGVRVVITHISIPGGYHGEVSYLLAKLREIENLNVVFAIVASRSRIYVIGRGNDPGINIGMVLSKLGGGGHPTAASAVLKDVKGIEEAKEMLIQALGSTVGTFKRASDIMTSPVRTVEVGTSVEKARGIMLRLGHSSIPVTRNGELVGIVKGDELEKAIRFGFGKLPIDFFTRSAETVPEDAPLGTVHNLMTQPDVDRVLVTREGDVIGIITRFDLIRELEQDERWKSEYEKVSPGLRDLSRVIRERLPKGKLDLLVGIGRLSQELGMEAYLVGGPVRDLLLGMTNIDLDIVVEGDGIGVAKAFSERFGGKLLKQHKSFGTATVEMEDGMRIDFATARTEFYEYPAAMPHVEFGAIKQDLYRRDFTINAMAIRLGEGCFGMLLDFFGGRRDIKRRKIRVLHPLSFIEDPTRILRAIRFEAKLGFRMEQSTEELISKALQLDVFSKLTKGRLKEEVVAILSDEAIFLKALLRMQRLGLIKHIFGIEDISNRRRELERLGTLMKWIKGGSRWISVLMVLFQDLDEEGLRKAMDALSLSLPEKKALISSRGGKGIAEALMRCSRRSEIYKNLNGLSPELLLFLAATNPEVEDKIRLYKQELEAVRPEITGDDLKAMGLKPGPIFRRILRSILEMKLDGAIKSREEEVEYVLKGVRDGRFDR